MTRKWRFLVFILFFFSLILLMDQPVKAAGQTAVKNGWVTEGKETRYYKNGRAVTGIQSIGANLYLFDGQGRRQYGWHKVGSNEYYCDPSYYGALATGIQKIKQTTYIFNNQGAKESGWHRIWVDSLKRNGDFYFDPLHGNGMVTGLRTVGKGRYLFHNDGYKVYGWHRLAGKDYYFDPKSGNAYVGTQTINGATYLFNEDGSKQGLILPQAVSEEEPLESEIKGVAAPEEEKGPDTTSARLYSLKEFRWRGVIYWQGKKYSYYSEKVLPGCGLCIPGRHVNEDGYVCDGDGYIVLANDKPKGTIVETPFGHLGKIYDRGTYGNHYDVYIH